MIRIMSFALLMSYGFSVQGMYRAYQMGKPRGAQMAKVVPALSKQIVAQPKRYYWLTKNLKELSADLPPSVSHLSPARGAAVIESNMLQNMLAVDDGTFSLLIQIVKLLFHQLSRSEPVKPTDNKSLAGFSLTPEILGLIVGALEKGVLGDAQVKRDITIRWQGEYAKITGEKKRFSTTKIENLIDLIDKAYKQDKDDLLSILLAFLYAKAKPENNHDMIHFLSALNEYIVLFPEAKGEAQKSFFDKLKQAFNSTRDYFSGYTRKDYTQFKEKLGKSIQNLEDFKKDFSLAISSMIYISQDVGVSYSPPVIYGSYGYKGKPKVSSCVEAAFQDLLNNLVYDSNLKIFDLSLLPTSLQVNPALSAFYQKYNSADTVNFSATGQAFMDLVSGIDGIDYVNKDYELDPGYNETNLIKLMNYFFTSNVSDLNELGKMFSDERRKVTFERAATADEKNIEKIMIHLIDVKNDTEKQIDFCWNSEHGFLELPQSAKYMQILNPSFLANQYNLDPQARSFFALTRSSVLTNDFLERELLKTDSLNPSAYYTLGAHTDQEKIKIFYTIVKAKESKTESIAYAISLLKSLPENVLIDQLPHLLKSRTFFPEEVNKEINEMVIAIINKYPMSPQITRFVINNKSIRLTYEQIKDKTAQQKFIAGIFIEAAMLRKLNIAFVNEVWNSLSDIVSPHIFLAEALNGLVLLFNTTEGRDYYQTIANGAYKTYFSVVQTASPEEIFDFVKNFLNQVDNLNIGAINTGVTPVIAAMLLHNEKLLNLLLDHDRTILDAWTKIIGPIENARLISVATSYHLLSELRGKEITPLSMAVYMENIEFITFLLNKGADIFKLDRDTEHSKSVQSFIDWLQEHRDALIKKGYEEKSKYIEKLNEIISILKKADLQRRYMYMEDTERE